MRRFVALSFLAACTLDPGSSTSSSHQAIIGGTASSGDQATVMLASFPANKSYLITCTAVLVSPTVLLTAAHCVDPATHAGETFAYFAEADGNAYDTLAKLEPHLLPIQAVHANPSYAGLQGDIAVAILSAPSTLPVAAINRTTLDASVVGKTATIVGYGQTVYQTPNQKRFEASTTVVSLDTGVIEIGDAGKHTCIGDSGGPAFIEDKVVGIDAYGPNGCTGASHFTRVDAVLPFIDQYVTTPGGPDAGPGGGDDDDDMPMASDDGGCSSSSSSSSSGALLVVGLALALRRRCSRA